MLFQPQQDGPIGIRRLSTSSQNLSFESSPAPQYDGLTVAAVNADFAPLMPILICIKWTLITIALLLALLTVWTAFKLSVIH